MKKIIKFLLSLIAIILIVYIASPSHVKTSFKYWFANVDDYKIFPNDTMQSSQPIAMPKGNIKSLTKEQEKLIEDKGGLAFLVIQHDSIIYEGYFNKHTESSISGSFSMAKSVTSLCIGKAIEEGYIKSVDQPISDFLPELNTDFNGKEATIKDFLSMAAGLNQKEQYINPYNMTTEAYYGNDLMKTAKKLKLVREPGALWEYQSMCTQVLGMVVSKATKKSLAQYANEKIWQPMGMENAALWSSDKIGGETKAFCCINATARDFSKLGLMVLHQGFFNDKQIIDSNYIAEATKPASYTKFDNKPVNHYGYQFWIMHHKNMEIPYFCGILGQLIFVIPEKDAVIVRLGTKIGYKSTTHEEFVDAFDYVDIGLSLLK